MSGATTAVIAAAAVASTAIAYKNGQDQKDAAKRASEQAQKNADRVAAQADQANNRVNQRPVDTSAILSAAQQAGKAGASGVDPSTLSLGKSTLLGG